MKFNEFKIRKNSNSLIIGGATIIGLFLLGFLLKSGIENFKAAERVVSVKGLAEKEYPANRVIWPIMFKEAGNNLPELYSVVEKKNQEIMSFLKNHGISDAEMTLNTPEVVDMEADRYASQTNRIFRYSVTSVLTVYSEKVNDVRKIMSQQSELIKKGVP
ncbi:MAG: SIMPL domain-containing protein, partial [Bacteroidota bacterium]|nr:SIMPL domain-containing protein [Bacteroidota bacterium]